MLLSELDTVASDTPPRCSMQSESSTQRPEKAPEKLDQGHGAGQQRSRNSNADALTVKSAI